jgi:hypothetical protein
MTETQRPPGVSEPEWLHYLQPLLAGSVQWKLEALDRITAHAWVQALPALLPLLHSDLPYTFVRRHQIFIAELRAAVLETVEELYRVLDQPPDFGPVKVRAPMPASEAITAAEAALAALPADQRALTLARVAEGDLTSGMEAAPDHAAALRAYRTLQALGQIEYRTESVDPDTHLTPLQAELIADQTRAPRPTPNLRVARTDKPAETLGWVYRQGAGPWMVDFSDARDAQDVAGWIRRVLYEVDRAGVPRVARDATGVPRRDPEGRFVFDGVVPLDSPDAVDFLRNLALFVSHEAHTELTE